MKGNRQFHPAWNEKEEGEEEEDQQVYHHVFLQYGDCGATRARRARFLHFIVPRIEGGEVRGCGTQGPPFWKAGANKVYLPLANET